MLTRDTARGKAVEALIQASEIAMGINVSNGQAESDRVTALVNIATEWRYLSEEL